ncbi:MAG: hypothetical protein WAO95_06970 [Burkholderiales bacterium]
MACASASTSYREKLSEPELLRALLTGGIAPRRRPHFRMLLDESPVGLLKGLAEEVGRYVQPGRVKQPRARYASGNSNLTPFFRLAEARLDI